MSRVALCNPRHTPALAAPAAPPPTQTPVRSADFTTPVSGLAHAHSMYMYCVIIGSNSLGNCDYVL